MDELQKYATEAQIEYCDRLRSDDDPEHQCAQGSFKESCGEASAGATYADALAALGLRKVSTAAHNARTFDNNTMAAKDRPPMECLVGKKIIEVRQMTEEEAEYEGWPGAGDDTVLVLDDGTRVFASSDEEGNNPGALFVRQCEMTWRAKGLCDGAKSIEEMAARLEETATWLRKLAGLDCELVGTVEDDYATVIISAAAVEAELATGNGEAQS